MSHIMRTKPPLPRSAWGRGDLTPPNIPDYENNLAFAPRVTYRDVRKHARELAKKKDDIFYSGNGWFRCGYIWVYKNLKISTSSLDKEHLKLKDFGRVKMILDAIYGD